MIPVALRAALLAALALLVLLVRSPRGTTEPAVVHLAGGDDGDHVIRAAAVDSPLLIVREADTPPTAEQLSALDAATAAGAALIAMLPAAPPAATPGVVPPLHAERAAALPFTVNGVPAESLRVIFSDAAGPLDTVDVALDALGTGAGALRVRPGAQGWHEWTLAAADDTARTGGWARPPSPLRVRVIAGPPSWETRFVLRALEEAGAEVTIDQPLGGGLVVGGPAAATATPHPYDVVLLMPDAERDEDRTALLDFAATGGGIIIAGDSAAARAFGLLAAGAGAASASALGSTATGPAGAGRARGSTAGDDSTGLDWSLPPELAALPPAGFPADIVTFATPAPGVLVAALHDRRPALLLANVGRGRIAAVGPAETWRWRMQAGRLAEHRAFWGSLAEWAAAGRDSIFAAVSRPIVAVGERVRIEVDGSGAPLPPNALLRRPDGTQEPVTLPVVDLVAADTGVHTLIVGDDAVAAVRSVGVTAHTDAWSRLARIARRSGGRAVAAGQMDEAVSAWRDSHGARSDPLAAVIFVALTLAACAEWAIRRLRGQR